MGLYPKSIVQLDARLGQFSSRLWPANMVLLCLACAAATLLDYLTTYHLLELSGKPAIEGNAFSRALLEQGGWRLLFIKDLIAVGIYAIAAFAVYKTAATRNMAGLGRFLSVAVLLVYLLARLIPAINNTLLAYL